MGAEIIIHIGNCLTNFLLCYSWNRVLNCKYKQIWSWLVFFVITLIEELYVIFIGRDNILAILSLIFVITFILIMFKNPLTEKAIAFAYVYSSVSITDLFITIIVFIFGFDKTYQMIIIYIFYACMFLLLCSCLNRVWNLSKGSGWNKRMIGSTFTMPLWVLIVLLSISILWRDQQTYTSYLDMFVTLHKFNIICLILVFISCITFTITYTVIMHFTEKEIKKNEIQTNLENLKNKNRADYEYYLERQKNYQSVQKYRHDLNNILFFIDILQESSETNSDKVIKQLKEAVNQLHFNEKLVK